MTLMLSGNTTLRRAIRSNLVTFPSQIPRLLKRPAGDMQQRIVQLFFVRGWSARDISRRFGLSKARVLRILADWKIRAIDSGWIQEIEPGLGGMLDSKIIHSGGFSAGLENPLRAMEPPISRPGTPYAGYNGTSDLLPTTPWPSRSKYSIDGENSAAS
jgi:hypothetical protein